MLLSSSYTLSADKIALALDKGVRHAKRTWLSHVTAQIMQTRDTVAPYASASVLSGPFLMTFFARGGANDALVRHTMDERKLGKAIANLLAMEPESFGRVAAGKATVYDCATLLQLATFGQVRIDPNA